MQQQSALQKTVCSRLSPVQETPMAPHGPWVTVKALCWAHLSMEELTPACPASPFPARRCPLYPPASSHLRFVQFRSLGPSLPSPPDSHVCEVFAGRPARTTPFSVSGCCLSPSEDSLWILTKWSFHLFVICELLSAAWGLLGAVTSAPCSWALVQWPGTQQVLSTNLLNE